MESIRIAGVELSTSGCFLEERGRLAKSSRQIARVDNVAPNLSFSLYVVSTSGGGRRNCASGGLLSIAKLDLSHGPTVNVLSIVWRWRLKRLILVPWVG